MKRGITNKAALIAALATNQQARAIEYQGGVWVQNQPNREMRRRMQREARSKKKEKS